jgi:hypothetical protein
MLASHQTASLYSDASVRGASFVTFLSNKEKLDVSLYYKRAVCSKRKIPFSFFKII